MNKQELINTIIPLVKDTHNDKDIADLYTFSLEELKEMHMELIEWIRG